MPEKQKNKTVAISGGFDPLHIGHIRLIREAKKLGDKLLVILNNDNWLKKKKGFVFMREIERKEILEALKEVDEVMISFHSRNPSDMSVSLELAKIRPMIFANGGDRKSESDIPETAVCRKENIRMIFNVGKGGKMQSSSLLAKKVDYKFKKRSSRSKE
jgi:cytidyltransferase-like protein